MRIPSSFLADVRDTLRSRSRLTASEWPLAAEALLVQGLRESTQRDVLWVCDGQASQDERHRDLSTLFPAATDDVHYYPAWQTFPDQTATQDPLVSGRRLATLARLADHTEPCVIVASIQALQQRTLSPDDLRDAWTRLAMGDARDRDALLEELAAAGYAVESEVLARGQAAAKGGIVDVWPVCDDWPSRIELFGSDIESIRTFDPADQRSLERTNTVSITPVSEWSGLRDRPASAAGLLDYIGSDFVCVWSDLLSIDDHAAIHMQSATEAAADDLVTDFDNCRTAVRSEAAFEVETGCAGEVDDDSLGLFRPLREAMELPREVLEPDTMNRTRQKLLADLGRLAADGYAIAVFFDTQGSRQRFSQDSEPGALKKLKIEVGVLSGGFVCDRHKLVVVAESDVYGRRKESRERYDPAPARARAREVGPRLDDLGSLDAGDYVVHLDHGIGTYLGLRVVTVNEEPSEAIAVEYADGAVLYVPVTQVHLLSRYIGAGKRFVRRHKLGGKRWAREKLAAETAVQDLASALIETQAARDALPGYAFPEDSAWLRQLEAAFPYRETADQEEAIIAVKHDMQQARPMDRLVCGDSGYGKTEVAIRAAFKAVTDAKQVVVLVPTTVLAQQHYDTFRQRMAPFPVHIEMISRFRTRGEQDVILRELKAGTVDIVVGTHGLLQPNVAFHDLGLVIIDEEQRFGVAHKEKLKRLRTLVDVLTLSATPIPRTLYMGLTGAKDLSTIETPPQERRDVETIVRPYDERLIREIILRELNREGQVYYIHNRVMTIGTVYQQLSKLVPEATIAIGHGQMPSSELANVMHQFVDGAIDVLLCTTIVESGVDVPNANSIIIDRADRFGLADLYQLRGRVGRSSRKAYAVLMTPGRGSVDPVARKRIGAIQRHSEPGSGFRIALRDLEIRGAGNLLGREQSGHIAAVGFSLYCQLLQRTVQRLKGETAQPVIDVDVRLDFVQVAPGGNDDNSGAGIPCSYIQDERIRLNAYRGIAALGREQDVERLRDELADRFGPVPRELEALLLIARIRIAAQAREIRRVETRNAKLMLTGSSGYLKTGAQFPRLESDTVHGQLNEILELIDSA